jgi:hypothetical protein
MACWELPLDNVNSFITFSRGNPRSIKGLITVSGNDGVFVCPVDLLEFVFVLPLAPADEAEIEKLDNGYNQIK